MVKVQYSRLSKIPGNEKKHKSEVPPWIFTLDLDGISFQGRGPALHSTLFIASVKFLVGSFGFLLIVSVVYKRKISSKLQRILVCQMAFSNDVL